MEKTKKESKEGNRNYKEIQSQSKIIRTKQMKGKKATRKQKLKRKKHGRIRDKE